MSDASNLKRVHSLVAPIIADLKLDLYDLEFRGGTLRVTIDTPAGSTGGVDLEAIALATRPQVLILDEPAAGVPSVQSELIFERISALPKDMTLLFIEHDMNLVFRFAERISVLVSGAILTEGTPDEIRADERVREVYLGRRGHHAAA